jgi:glutamine cyclotransferase
MFQKEFTIFICNMNLKNLLLMTRNIPSMIIALVLSLTMMNVYSQEIIHTIPAPGVKCQDVTWDGTYIWATDNVTKEYYQLDPEDGTVIKSIPFPTQVPYSEGITFDGEYLWTCGWEESNGNGSHLFKMDPETGDILASLAYPGEYSGNWPHGITFDGNHLWANNFATHTLDKINPSNAELIDTLSAPGEFSIGIAWDGEYLWTNDFNQSRIFKQDPYTGEVLGSAYLPIVNMRGLAWDGNYLWTVSWEAQTIYKIDVGPLSVPETEKPFFSLYPNPGKGIHYISTNIPQKGPLNIQVMDMQGRIIRNLVKGGNPGASHTYELNLAYLPDGMYILKVVMPEELWCEKLILKR